MSKTKLLIAAVMFIAIGNDDVCAQSNISGLEVGGQFTTIHLSEFDETTAGFGARLTYNVSSYIALEGEVNFFPQRINVSHFTSSGQRLEGLFGIKSGIRSKRVGVFGKLKPGLIHFSQQHRPCTIVGPVRAVGCAFLRTENNFALDLGGVVEFYPWSSITVRFDTGDTVIRYGGFEVSAGPARIVTGSFTSHNFQISAGVTLRLLR
jgi:hypothetical protein